MALKLAGQCIYCRSSTTWSREHSLPRGLGAFDGHHILYRSVCGSCNGSLKICEEQFLRVGPQGFYRHILGIRGRGNEQGPSPYYRRSAGAPPVEMRYVHPETGYEILWEVDPENNMLVELSQIVFRLETGGTIEVLLPPDLTINCKADLVKLLERAGISNPSEVKPLFVSADPDVYEVVTAILCDIYEGVGIDAVDRDPKKRQGSVKVPVKVSVTDLYFRAVAKIGFHYFLSVFAEHFSGEEDYFDPIRNFIFRGAGSAEDFVKEKRGQVVENLRQDQTLAQWSHILTAQKERTGQVVVRLQFFIGPSHVPLINEVVLAKKIPKIIYPPAYGHLYRYYEEKSESGHDGVVTELEYGSAAARPV